MCGLKESDGTSHLQGVRSLITIGTEHLYSDSHILKKRQDCSVEELDWNSNHKTDR